MAPDQYEKNVEVRPASNQRVEFANELPGGEGGPLWLPIDAKFPTEDYERLTDASERGDLEAIEAAAKGLEIRIRQSANDISTKYLHPPFSTDFAILFLADRRIIRGGPSTTWLADSDCEGAENYYYGPTTLLALLNSLRMGFRTLAIQKRSSEVWQILSAVKAEFGKYGVILDRVQKLQEASSTIDGVTVRRRAIDRKLRSVEVMPELEAAALLGISNSDPEEQEQSAAE